MTPRIQRFREAISRLEGGRGAGSQFTDEIRGEAAAIALEGQKQGQSVQRTAELLGVNISTLRFWIKRSRGKVLRKVRVRDEPIAVQSPLALVTPGGFRVEGLTVETLLQILKSMA